MKLKNYDIGVVVGRFQVDQLHEAHCQLVEGVLSKHKKVLICLGVTPVLGSPENPLDYQTREFMLKERFPDATVIPIADCNNDAIWSKNLDFAIRTVFPIGEICLYGGRDSFIAHYEGVFDTFEIPSLAYKAATEIRLEIAKEYGKTREWRRGKINAYANQFPRAFVTVDIAVVSKEGKKHTVLLGKKKYENGWRFPGGFLDPNESLEQAAKREIQEEVGIEVNDPTYIGSYIINDWRYRKSQDSIMTTLFYCERVWGPIEARDDLDEVREFPIRRITRELIVDAHKPLFDELLKYLKKGNEDE